MGILLAIAAYSLLGFIVFSFIQYVFCEDKTMRRYEEFPIPKWLNFVLTIKDLIGKAADKIIEKIPKYHEEEKPYENPFIYKELRQTRKDTIDYFQGRMKK